MANLRILLSFGIVFAVTISTEASIKCYTCASTNTDLTCLNDPASVSVGSPITDCQFADCCTILRQEYRESPGIISFGRGCQPNCKKDGFYETQDSSFNIYWTYCSDPLCNSGKGDEDIGGGGGGDEGGSIDGILGKDGAVSNMASFMLTLSLATFVWVLTIL